RSTDKKNWENKNAVAATGNSSVPVSYTTTDEVSSIKGNLYYRLIQFDLNGDSYTSKVVQLDLNNNIKPTINIYPNPTTTHLYVEGLNEGASVYNVLGTRLLEIKDNNTIIDVSAFPKGIYFIKSGNEIKRFIIE
ncbi:MAG: T9SS type A sorting domain-containing protein, partial [Bacteroidota bacterium]